MSSIPEGWPDLGIPVSEYPDRYKISIMRDLGFKDYAMPTWTYPTSSVFCEVFDCFTKAAGFWGSAPADNRFLETMTVTMIRPFTEHGSRVYAIDPEAFEELSGTKVDKVIPEFLEWPLPAFSVFLPKGAMHKEGRAVVAIWVYFEGTHINLTTVFDSGITASLRQPADLKFSDMVVRNRESRSLTISREACDVYTDLSKESLAMVIRMVIAMSVEPESLAAGAIVEAFKSPKKKRIMHTPKRLCRPWIIRKTEDAELKVSPGYSGGSGTDRAPVSPHWRSGHMRMQRFGPGKEQQRAIWIKHTLVGKKKENS